MGIPWGDGDPSIGAKCQEAHDQAQHAGEAMYLDPDTGLWVMTAAYLRSKGRCCGKGCRHCPFDRLSQEAAGRACLRPSSL